MIELMITVAVIGMLAAIALPAYESYAARAKMSEVILAMAGCRTSIAELYQSGGSPPGAGNWGCESVTTRYVAGIATDVDGKVTATVKNVSSSIDTKTVTMIPMASAAVFASSASDMGTGLYGWLCGGVGTTVALKYLPSSCRGY